MATQSSHLPGQFLEVPMHFEVNQGQALSPVEFVSRGPGYTLFLSPGEAVLSLRVKQHSKNGSTAKRTQVREARLAMKLVGASQAPRSEGVERLPGVVNYLLGRDPSDWRTAIPTFGKVKYHQVYPGIDLVYYGKQQQLEYDFIVHPSADPKQIAFRLHGAEGVEIEADGQLRIDVAGGTVRWHKPVAYQESAAGRTEVPAQFSLNRDGLVAFEVGEYDQSRPLIIDPVVVYSTYLGGSGSDFALGIAVHTGGSVYVVGDTTSLNFPTQSAYRTTAAGSNDVFVTRLNASGSGLVYSTYIGGAGDDFAGEIVVDAAGNAFITGHTDSPNFPTRNAAYTGNAGFYDVFLTKIGPNGTNLVYSTYLGGAGDDFGRSVAIDNSGSAYVTGRTYSRGTGNGPFPTTQGAFQRSNGNGNTIGADAFVTKFNTNGALVYSSFLGGDSEERANAIAVDSSGNAYVVGEVSSFPIYPDPPSSNFPLLNAFQAQFNQGTADPLAGTSDGFVTKFNADGSALVFSTFLGGFDNDTVTGICLDTAGRIGLTGITSSTNFPALNAAQPQNAGVLFSPDFPGPDAFVTQFQNNGATLLYSTYLGGAVDEFPFILDRFGIAADRFGNLYVAGQTGSEDFPVTQGADQTNAVGSVDGFVAKINPAAVGRASLVYASFISGSRGVFPGPPDNEAGAIAVDNNGSFFVAGITSATNFPVTAGAYRTTSRGGFNDTFVAKFSSPADISVSMIPATNPAIMGSNVTYTIRVYNNGFSTFTGVSNVVQFPGNVRLGAISTSAGNFSTNAGLVTFNIGTMTNNAAVTQTIVVAHLTPGVFTNTATVSSLESPSGEPNKANNQATVVASVRGIADLSLVQSALPTPTFVTSNLTFTIGITNKGPSPATATFLTNPLPANLAFVSLATTAGVCVTNTNGVVCNFGTLPSGAGARVTIATTAQTSGTVANVPVAAAFEADFVPGNNSSNLLTAVIPVTEIALGMSVATNQVYAASNIVFTLRVTNFGPSTATGLLLTNPFPAGATFVTATTTSGTTNLSANGIGFSLGSLAGNAVASATVTFRAPAIGSLLLNAATATNSAGFDPLPANNAASASSQVIAHADLGVTQSANPTSLAVSSNTTFLIAVTNRGPSAATNVTITETLGSAFAVVSAQSTAGSCQVLNNIVTCNLGTLNPGVAGSVTIVARPAVYGVFNNSAVISSSLPDLISANNQANVTVTVTDLPDRPTLTITRLGTNVLVSWSTNATARGFVLQSRNAMSPASSWTAVTNIPVTVGRDSMVTNSLAAAARRYYRLVQSPQTLEVRRVGNSVVISWPATSSTAVLRRTTSLSNSPVWTSAGNATLVGNRYYVTNAITGSRTFYRLFN